MTSNEKDFCGNVKWSVGFGLFNALCAVVVVWIKKMEAKA